MLRRDVGDRVCLFNGRDGEFDAEIVELKKKGGFAAVKAQTREQEAESDLTLCFAPVKRGPLEQIVQKATEIGVMKLTPVITERTVAPKLNIDRLQAIATEAAEQCGRLSVPSVEEPVKLSQLIDVWPEGVQLIYCDEAGDDEAEEWGGAQGRAAPALEALRTVDSNADQWSVLTGPEGGFTVQERTMLRAVDFVTPVTLGPRILRGGYGGNCRPCFATVGARRLAAALKSRIGDEIAAWPLRARRIERHHWARQGVGEEIEHSETTIRRAA